MANFCYVFEMVSISTMYNFTITPVISCFEQLLNSLLLGLALIAMYLLDQTLTH